MRSLRYFVEAPLRRPWHVLVSASLLLLGALALGLRLPPRYRAVALVLAEPAAADERATSGLEKDLADERSRAVRRRLLDPAVVAQMLQALGPRQGARGRAEIEGLLDAVRVRPEGKNAFRIECVQPDAARAAWIANFLAAQLALPTTIGHFELLRRASVPNARESPGLVLLALAGAVLGLAAGVAVALVAEALDRTVKGPEDLAAILPQPLLATIPLARVGKERRGA
jgi:uncharacterized protein involved in exopolysaccharide biosynthesis